VTKNTVVKNLRFSNKKTLNITSKINSTSNSKNKNNINDTISNFDQVENLMNLAYTGNQLNLLCPRDFSSIKPIEHPLGNNHIK